MKSLTPQEYADLVASDPVLQFIDRIEQKLPKHPGWDTDYLLATYLTLTEEITAYYIKLGIGEIKDHKSDTRP